MFVCFLLVLDLLFILFRIALWPSVGKELSPWLFTCVVLCFVPFSLYVSLSHLVFGAGCGIRLFRFLIIAFYLLLYPVHHIDNLSSNFASATTYFSLEICSAASLIESLFGVDLDRVIDFYLVFCTMLDLSWQFEILYRGFEYPFQHLIFVNFMRYKKLTTQV